MNIRARANVYGSASRPRVKVNQKLIWKVNVGRARIAVVSNSSVARRSLFRLPKLLGILLSGVIVTVIRKRNAATYVMHHSPV